MAVSLPPLRPRRRRGGEHVLEPGAASTGATRRPHAAPLVAVCGVCGGAGASTLSYLLARYAVRQLDGHVLVCDSGSSGGAPPPAGGGAPRAPGGAGGGGAPRGAPGRRGGWGGAAAR